VLKNNAKAALQVEWGKFIAKKKAVRNINKKLKQAGV